jgi:hypothetical protein
MNAGTAGVVEWAWAGAPIEGDRSGDAHVVEPFPGGTLVAAIDGLGHGPEAADAAELAAQVMSAHAAEPVAALVQRCHEALRGTRGVALSVVSIDVASSSLTWASVGNVEAFLLRRDARDRKRESVMQRGGIVGYQLPTLRADRLGLAWGDTLVLATDGIRSSFIPELAIGRTPEELARSIFERHARGSDDALVLVARYVGGAP